MNYPNQGLGVPKIERPPTEIESELAEAKAVAQSITESISKLESRLASVTVTSTSPNKECDTVPPCPALTPLAGAIKSVTDQNRDSFHRINRLIDAIQVPY